MNLWMLAAPQAAATQSAAGGLMGLLPMVIVMIVLWFMMIAPQRKQQKQREQMLKSLKKGDKVVTIGGMHGEITEIDEEDVKLRVADKTEVKFSRSSIAKIKG
ncbi:MAG TPA: preprotein translocase subunit YajC [Bacillota bacterium]|nr:preprotein translocase subunit YajC [Bacillota bacterium]